MHEIRGWDERRTVRFRLTDIEPKDQARYAGDRRGERFWRPTYAEVLWQRGSSDGDSWLLRSVTASGPRLKKDGTESATSHFQISWSSFLNEVKFPEWLSDVVEDSKP